MELDCFLRPIALFSQLDTAQLTQVAAHGALVQLKAGDALFHQGDVAQHFYVLVSGHMKVSQITPAGEQVLVRVLKAGQLCGIAKALGRTDYPGTAQAIDNCTLVAWPMEFWTRLLEINPAMAGKTLHEVGQRLDEAHTRIQEISTQDVEQRLAHALLRLGVNTGKENGNTVSFSFPIARQDLAEMIGTTLHSVSRLIAAWESKGLVKGGRMKLEITDVAKLRELANGG